MTDQITTLYIIEGCGEGHRFAEILGGTFGDRVDRVCVGCLVAENDRGYADKPCPTPWVSAAGPLGGTE